jgi:nucleoside 2-deoxyribosyltransferase
MATKNRIFVSFAIEDKWARDYLVGQAKNERSPFEFVDMSVKEPWKEDWKDRCRTKIRGCDGVIAIISKNTPNASGARWEMSCAIAERIPMIGLRAQADDSTAPPPEFGGKRVIAWTWKDIAAFIDSLP